MDTAPEVIIKEVIRTVEKPIEIIRQVEKVVEVPI